jgi:hypothetical protein
MKSKKTIEKEKKREEARRKKEEVEMYGFIFFRLTTKY